MSLKEDIEKLMSSVACDANKDGVSLEARIDALKVLNPFYTVLAKSKGRVPDDDTSSGPSFGDFRADLKVVEAQPDGASQVRSHRRT